ncbi:hypothetical protein PR001_g21300 [Phytophthora rubi]|uniref:Reverse transcriptase Ty1/copia-type domain-containing protein n=1 Tax=Phytophthora rubi TaxID=129364 RepID=A0A6A3JBV0_9STRA|nr:hypothetical protein PR001_g21300 [Phytophthora rubi]
MSEELEALQSNETWEAIVKPPRAKPLHSKVVFVLARVWGVPVRHGDVPNANVKAKKEEHLEILMHIPQGMCYTDSCLYFRRVGDAVTLIGVYVDDLHVDATRTHRVDAFFEEMSVPQLKDLGRVTKFLGINFDYDETSGWMLDQKQTIKEMLERFNLSGANPVRVHIGDWRLAKKITRYLKRPIDVKFRMEGKFMSGGTATVNIEGYSDADHAPDQKKRKSASGGAVCVNGVVVG